MVEGGQLPEEMYVEDPNIISYLEAQGYSQAEAEALARWQWYAHRYADQIRREFEQIVSLELDSDRRVLLVYVAGDGTEVASYVQALDDPYVTVEVRGGYLPEDVVAEHWYQLEEALLTAGVSVIGGAVGPNEITVFTDEPQAAQGVIAEQERPEDLNVRVEATAGSAPPQPARWQVHPDEELTESTTTVQLLVEELSCASGKSAAGRIVEPDLVYEADRAVVSISVNPLPGFQDCPGNPLTPYVLHLEESLDGRPLVDGNLPKGKP